jgi:adenylate cyclase, class 2
MSTNNETEIKFHVRNPRMLARRLREAGFRLITPPTHEMNTLYDLPEQRLRRNGAVLRLRQYGKEWLLTHKAKRKDTNKEGRHKTRIENQTGVADGRKMDAILRALGYQPNFRYEKFRAEWSDGKGHVVSDETPIGSFGEIEGSPRWIDKTARLLGVSHEDYLTASYPELFSGWKKRTKSSAGEMTFKAVRVGTKNRKAARK